MKKILILAIILLFWNCSIPYDGETRLILETNVVDSSGNPLKNQEVLVYVSDQQDFLTDNISKGFTNSNGSLVLIFPSPIGENYKFEVTFSKENNNYLEKNIFNISQKNFKNFKLDLGTIKLIKIDEIINFQILQNRVSSNNFLKNISISAIQPELNLDFNPLANIPEQFYFNQNFQIFKNQNFILKYTIVDPSINQIGSDYSINLSASNINFDYTITY